MLCLMHQVLYVYPLNLWLLIVKYYDYSLNFCIHVMVVRNSCWLEIILEDMHAYMFSRSMVGRCFTFKLLFLLLRNMWWSIDTINPKVSGDATLAFDDVGHSNSAISMMDNYVIGTLQGYDPSGEPSRPEANSEGTDTAFLQLLWLLLSFGSPCHCLCCLVLPNLLLKGQGLQI